MNEWRRQAAIREMSALNDHLLADIGLRRDQLPTFILQAPKRDRALATEPSYRPEPLPCG
jgi:uncharacterized protein YjiS (DUF1127 family)